MKKLSTIFVLIFLFLSPNLAFSKSYTFDKGWFFPKNKKIKFSLSKGKLSVKANDLEKEYIYTGGSLWLNKRLDKEKSLKLREHTVYKVKLNGEVKGDLSVQFWILMYDQEKRIASWSKSIGFSSPVYFRTPAEAKYYRLALRFSGSGEINLTSLDLSRISSNKKELMQRYTLLLQDLLEKDFSNALLAGFLSDSSKAQDLQAILNSFFPNLKNKSIKRTGLTEKESFEDFLAEKGQKIEVKLKGYPNYQVSLPIDWEANPFENKNWAWKFQNLQWLKPYIQEESKEGLILAGFVISDWFEKRVLQKSPWRWTWEDYALAKRFNILTRFIFVYIDEFAVLDAKVLENTFKAILTHICALASNKYYPKRIPYNHAISMDIALLDNILKFKNLEGREEVFNLAEQRILEQFRHSFTSEGIHVENSPAYQLFCTNMLKRVKNIYQSQDMDFSALKSLHDLYKMARANLAYMVHPNFTFAQFGDTPNKRYSRSYFGLDTFADQDKVFPLSGYAYFRSRSKKSKDVKDALVCSFTCNNLSEVHYHRDETSFSLYGFGTEIIVDSGLYNYNYDQPLNKYRYSAFAHNVLIVDDQDFKVAAFDGSSKIVDYKISNDYSWVKGRHNHYRHLGIDRLTRTLIHAKPSTFFIVDQARSKGKHSYKQLFHFYPDFKEVKETGENAWLVSSSLPGRPKLVLRPFRDSCSIIVHRGVHSQDRVQGWYFPEFNQKKKSSTLVLDYGQTKGEATFLVFMQVVAPGQAVDTPSRLNFKKVANRCEIRYKNKKFIFH